MAILAAVMIAALALSHPAPVLAGTAVAGSSQMASDTVQVDTLTAAPDAVQLNPAPPFELPPATSLAPASAAAMPPSNLLPFAHNDIHPAYPAVGIAIGVGAYPASFATVERAFHTIEDAYSAGGFPLPRSSDVALGAMMLFTLTVSLNRSLDLACQVGRSGDPFNELRLLGGIASCRYTLPGAPKLSASVGLGGGRYGYSFTRSYGVQVTPTDGSGGYYELERIKLAGGGPYWTIASGFRVRAAPDAAFDAMIQYIGMADESANAPRGGIVSVNLSSVMFSVSVTHYF